MKTDYIGQPTSRVDGRAKVTGGAKYTAEHYAPGLTHGVVVSSAISKGKITRLDTSKALQVNGVLQVFTHENRPGLAWFDKIYKDEDAPPGSPFRPLYDNKILFSQQPIALVVAETFEAARYGASLVEVEYEAEEPVCDLQQHLAEAYNPSEYKSQPPPKPRGDAAQGLAQAPRKIETEYFHPSEHHNPMEMHASMAVWEEDGMLTIYDKTQGVANSKQYISNVFGLTPKEARVYSPYVGGAFGSGLRPQYQLFMAVMAALELKRSVKVVLTRQQMFSFGHRPATLQKLALGAAEDGKLQGLTHEAFAETSEFEDYTENVVPWSGMLYTCDNVQQDHKLVKLNVYTPLDMRAPGGVTGMYALEAAMDELAYEVGMDPLELRLRNYTETDPAENKPFSSKELRACYLQGAERFGWSRRNPQPRSMREGNSLVGWGLATGAWEAKQQEASAKALLSDEGRLIVSSATSDIGTGTYTIMTQIAADCLGLPLEQVTFKLGDSTLPKAPLEGGSWTAGSVGSAVKAVCDELRKQLFQHAQQMENSPLAHTQLEDITFAEGQLRLTSNPAQAVSITEIMRHAQQPRLEAEVTTKPDKQQDKYSKYTHSAVFAEVKVDEDFGTITVSRVVSAIAGGKILNPKTAKNQIMGAVVWGISMALHEESYMDNNFGRFMNHNLSEYHVAINADVHDIDVIFVEEKDDIVNPLGVKGLGEIGIVGVAAAIANAVYHATGRRIKSLPITLDKVMQAM